jgi:hypothetical protein
VIIEVDCSYESELDSTHFDLFSFKESIRLMPKRRGMPTVEINVNEHLSVLNSEQSHEATNKTAFWVLKKGLRY